MVQLLIETSKTKFLYFQGFTYVAPSVLEEMHKGPRIVKARSPRKGPFGTSGPGPHSMRHFSPRHMLQPLPHGHALSGFTFGHQAPLDPNPCQEEFMEVQSPHV